MKVQEKPNGGCRIDMERNEGLGIITPETHGFTITTDNGVTQIKILKESTNGIQIDYCEYGMGVVITIKGENA